MNYLIESAQQTCNIGTLEAMGVLDSENLKCGQWKLTQANLHCGHLRRAFKPSEQLLQEYQAVVGC